MVQIVFDQLVEPPLVEVALERGRTPEFLQIHEDEVRVIAWLAIWRRPAQLGGRVDPLPAPEGAHVRVGLLRGHPDGLTVLLHLLKNFVEVSDVILNSGSERKKYISMLCCEKDLIVS